MTWIASFGIWIVRNPVEWWTSQGVLVMTTGEAPWLSPKSASTISETRRSGIARALLLRILAWAR
jgi:hypothetical protein